MEFEYLPEFLIGLDYFCGKKGESGRTISIAGSLMFFLSDPATG